HDPATTEIDTLSLHDALPISSTSLMLDTPWSEEAALLSRTVPHLDVGLHADLAGGIGTPAADRSDSGGGRAELERQIRRFEELRSEEHTSELQSLAYLVCRLL